MFLAETTIVAHQSKQIVVCRQLEQMRRRGAENATLAKQALKIS